MSENATPLPHLPCPSCGANILAQGFYNSCTETQRLREDNHTHVVNDYLYIDHNENSLETVEHLCDLEAFCRKCGKLLPWALDEIRGLCGVRLSQADEAIAKLLEQVEDGGPTDA
jgi:hypothetical protein